MSEALPSNTVQMACTCIVIRTWTHLLPNQEVTVRDGSPKMGNLCLVGRDKLTRDQRRSWKPMPEFNVPSLFCISGLMWSLHR
jgi:hypothetical protein